MPTASLDCNEMRSQELPTDVATMEKVRFLSDPRNYPSDECKLDVAETHFSWVFLTGAHAFKLKKPARGKGFDFRSPPARLRNATAEVRLNRRLAPRVYLGIVALTLKTDGALQLDGTGPPIDWLVKMVRLEASHMLEKRLVDGSWHYGELQAVAHHLAGFFARAPRAVLAFPAQTAQIRDELRHAIAAFSRVGEPRLRSRAEFVARSLDAFVLRRAPLFRRRVEERRLVDGHGDLRPEHVYLKTTPQIIDCLEFRSDLRRLDPVGEIAFLELECGRLAASPIGMYLIRRYRQRTGDKPPSALTPFYTALNAVVRARLAIDHLAEPGTRTREQWIARAAVYLAIAAKQCRQLNR
jgi:aminoglycoside phosphotransferase family enzyme